MTTAHKMAEAAQDLAQSTGSHAQSGSAEKGVQDCEQGVAQVLIDPELEARVMAKFDRLLMPQMALLVIIAYLDRSNIGNAKTFGFEAGLGLSGNQFGNLSTLFYPTYVAFEIPWVMAVKQWGANAVLAVITVGWSIITLGSGFIHTYEQGVAVRLFLGAFESGLFPCLTFVISTVYSREQQAKRVAVLYGAIALSGAFGGLIAYGIQLMGERAGLAAWRLLFIIEGAVSLVLGMALWATLPRDSTRAWFLSPEDKELMLLRRSQRDAAYKGDDEFSYKYIIQAFRDPIIYIAAVGMFCSSFPLFGFGTFLPTIIMGLGYSSLQANYLSTPVYIFACIILIFVAWLSDRLKRRGIVAMLVPISVLTGYAIAIGTASSGAGLFAMFLIAAGVYPYNTIVLTWVTNNLPNEHVRSVGIPLLISIANMSGIASSQIYPSRDAPRYIMGNSVSLAMEAVALLAACGLYVLLRHKNAHMREEASRKSDGTPGFTYVL